MSEARSETVQLSRPAYEAQQAIMKELRAKLDAATTGKTEVVSDNSEVLSELERLRAELAQSQAENVQLRAAKATLPRDVKSLALKVTDKGGVSVYGLGKWPLTLYPDTMLKLLDMTDDIRAFLVEHESELKVKPVKE